nr:hypothetical protein [Tanacetum cinerariifolium]
MVQSGGTVETSYALNEEIRAHQETVYRNLVDQVAYVDMVNHNMRATNDELKSELARYKIQEQCVEVNQEKYDKLEKCYQKSVYQEQCLTKKINALHLSSAKQIMILNDEISNLNKQLSKEKSYISSFMDEKKRVKHDFKIQEDKFLDKEVDPEAKIKDLENILLKKDQTVQTMHMLNPKPDSFYHSNQKRTLGYPNPSYLKKAQQKQQSSYNGNLLLEEHDPPVVYDSEETLELAQETYNDMQQKVKRLQAKLRDLKGKSSDTPSASNTLDPLNQKLESKIVELEFQVVNYEHEISHLKTTYKNLFDSIKSNQAHAKLHDLIFENAKLRVWLFEKTYESVKNTLGTSVTSHVDKPKLSVVTLHYKKLQASTQSHSVPQPREFNAVKHRNVITPRMFKINPSKMPRVDLVPNKQSSPKSKTRNARIPSASKSSEVKKVIAVEDYRKTLLLSKNRKTMSSECNNIKLAIRNDKSEIVCDICKQCLVTANHDACLTPSVNVLNSHANKLCANVPHSTNQKRHRTQVWKPKQVGSKERLACCSKHMTGNIKLLINFVWKFLGTVRFANDYIAAILGYEVAFRRNTCFIRDLDGVDLLKGYRSINLYTINLYDMASASPICLMARATPTKSWLWHQRLSHLNFDTINDLARIDLVSGLPKFKYAKEYLCPFCEQGKSKRASHPPKPISNSKQQLHLLHMDLCGPMRVASINDKRYVLVIVDDYSRYTWVYFLRTKDETPEVIKNFLKKIFVRL